MLLHLSSIFSFKMLTQYPVPTRAFCACVAFLLIILSVGLTVFHSVPKKYTWSSTRLGKSVDCLDNNLLLAAERDQSIVAFFGSSRLYSCADVETFSSLSKRDDLLFLNLARSGLDLWSASVILRNVESSLTPLRLAVFEVSPWFFNANTMIVGLGIEPKYERGFDKWATLQERWEIEEHLVRAELFWKMIPRYSLRDLGATLAGNDPTLLSFRRPTYHHGQGYETMRARAARPGALENVAKLQLNHFTFSQRKSQVFKRLLSFLKERNVQVVIVEPLLKEGYFTYLDAGSAYRLEFAKHSEFMRSLSKEVMLIDWSSSCDCDFDETMLIDYGHCSYEGSLAFSKNLWHKIEPVVNTVVNHDPSE